MMGDVIWEKYAPNPTRPLQKVGVNRQFQATRPKNKKRSISGIASPMNLKLRNKLTQTSWVV